MSKHEKPRKILFFLNPGSGRNNKEHIPELIEDFCSRHGIAHKLIYLDKSISCHTEIISYQPDVAVAAGGDGTVNAVGTCLLNSHIRLGIIPLGSSNALSKNLMIPQEPEEAIELLHNFNVKPIDTLKINDKYCLHICDIGFNANLIERFQKNSFRGMLSYAKSLVQELIDFGFFQYDLKTPKEELKGRAFSISITNTKYYGTMAAINPTGKINDGKFEICLIKPFPRISMIPMILKLFNRSIHHSRFSIFVRTSEATVVNWEQEGVHIDGETVEMDKTLHIKVLPHSLDIVVPIDVN